MSDDPVTLDIDDTSIATIRLNRPPMNRLTPALVAAFSDRLHEVRRMAGVRALIIAAEGKHFCVGADLTSEPPSVGEHPLGGLLGSVERLESAYAPFFDLLELPIPTVAAVNGAAAGGGLGLAAMCDFRVITPRTRFVAPFPKVALHPGLGLTQLLPALVGLPRAQEMLLLGVEVQGEQALDWGLATRCVPDDALGGEARALAQQLAASAPAVMRWTKRAIRRAIGLDPRAASEREALAQALTFASRDAEEGKAAFFERRPPRFTGE